MTPLDITLADLIARLEKEQPQADALARVSQAHLRSQTLADLGDQLVDHYVSQAKRGGASWAQIGQALGVSKQAAQQRQAGTPFELFTELARHSVVLAQEAARTSRHDLIGTEHLLLGLLDEPNGDAYRLLTATDSQRTVRNAVQEVMVPPGTRRLRGHIAFGSDSTHAIEQARLAAHDLGHEWVGTGHLLLGLSRTPDSPAAQALGALGFTSDGLREAVASAAAENLAPASSPVTHG